MKRKSLLVWLMLLLVTTLLFGCARPETILNDQEMLELKDISNYQVVDITGSNRFPVFDMMVDDRSWKVDFIVIKAPLSGFDMDIRTAPFRSKQILMIPQQFADLEVETKQFKLKVGLSALNNSPHFSLPIHLLPNDWRDTVDQYWISILEDKE